MKVSQALKNRKSTRAFLDKEVSPEKIRRILDAARFAPSGTNTQPWSVAVVSGETKLRLQERMESAFHAGEERKMEYHYYPVNWKDPYKSRRRECGLKMFKTLGITREDNERRISQWAANYRVFDAPVMLLFFIESIMETGSYMDCGIFLQSVMLAAMEEGLATCPQAALAEFPGIIRETLGYSEDYRPICGMALGYEDPDHIINSYRTDREEIESFTRFFD